MLLLILIPLRSKGIWLPLTITPAPPVARRTPLSDRQAVVAAAIVLVLVLVLVGWLVGAQLSAQVSDLLDRLPQAWQGLQDRLGVGALGEWLRGQAGAAGSGTGGVLASLVGYATTLGGALADLILVLIGGVFFAIRPDLYREGLVKLVPGEAARARVADTLDTCGRALRAWLLGQLVSMAIVGALTWLGLWLIGVPAAFALALLASLAEFVPMVGPVAATVLSVLVFAFRSSAALRALSLRCVAGGAGLASLRNAQKRRSSSVTRPSSALLSEP